MSVHDPSGPGRDSPDDDPFATGGHGRFMVDGASPPVIGGHGPPDDGLDETTPVGTRYDPDPPTSPIPVAPAGSGGAAAPGREKSWLGRMFGRS